LHRVSRDWAERVRTYFSDARRHATDRLEFWQIRIAHMPAAIPAASAIFVFIFAALLLLQPRVRQRLRTLWHLRVAQGSAMTPHLATIQYSEMLRLLARRGIRKAPAQTPFEFAASLPDGNLAAPVQELTTMYQAARFGGHATDPRRASSLLNNIQSFLRSQ
jgi:hypothetical protein